MIDAETARTKLDLLRRNLLTVERRAAQGQDTDRAWERIETYLAGMMTAAWAAGWGTTHDLSLPEAEQMAKEFAAKPGWV